MFLTKKSRGKWGKKWQVNCTALINQIEHNRKNRKIFKAGKVGFVIYPDLKCIYKP